MSSAEVNQRFHATWRHPFQNAQICLDAVPLRGLTIRALRFADKTEPSEVGGLLWGTIVSGPNGKTILVQQAEFIGADGNLFNTTEAGLERLAAALGRPRSNLQPLGYFRSAVRGDVFPREQDRIFVEGNLAGLESFSLIIEPLLTGTCTAHFYFFEDGRLQMKSSLLRVPLAPQSFSSEQEELETRRTPQLPELNAGESRSRAPRTEMMAPEYDHAPVHGDEFPASSGWGAGRTVFIAALLLAMAGVSVYRIMSSRATAPAAEKKAGETPIGLQVERKPDGQLDLNWNRNFARFAGPDGAQLSITDGSYVRTLKLTQDQLLSGKLAYFPRSDDIHFHLEISIGNNRTVGESIRVVSPEVYASTFPELDAPLTPAKTEFPDEPAKRNNVTGEMSAPGPRALTPAPGIVKTGTPGTYILASRPPATSPANYGSALKGSAAPRQQNQNGAVNRVPEPVITALPPPINTNQAKGNSNARLVAAIATRLSLPLSLPPVPAPVQPQVKKAELSASEPLVPLKRAPVTEAPTPVYQVMPNTKPFGYSLVNNDLQIDVEVHIDANGVVRQANLTANRSGHSTMLTGQALMAAREWRFKPAEVGGRRVPSIYVISFKFKRAP